STPKKKNIQDLNYAVYPRRRNSEAAVLEWGHSAIINAVDAVAATFGPQTSDGSYFEIEAGVVLSEPLDGGLGNGGPTNCPEMEGAIVMLTWEDVRANKVSPVSLASLVQKCGGGAAVVVRVTDDPADQDYVYPLEVGEGEEEEAREIGVPVVMISLNSGNMLAQGGEEGLPERVRIYKGGDRPYFEDVSGGAPLVYLIHNLLSAETIDESQYIVDLGTSAGFSKSGSPNWLEGFTGSPQKDVDDGPATVMLWKGGVDGALKAVDERINQVTGFPVENIGEWGVSKYEVGERKRPGYDGGKGTYHEQSASILVFLNDVEEGGEIYFPSGDRPVKILPKKGMAVVWHNSGQDGNLDKDALYGEMRVKKGTKYTVKKWVSGVGKGWVRANLLPILLLGNKGKSYGWMRTGYNLVLGKMGAERGHEWAEKILLGMIVLVVAGVGKAVEMARGGKKEGKEKGE
ncbi:hypothetical protein TrRE_jg6281, partial [Triparma retinervis]